MLLVQQKPESLASTGSPFAVYASAVRMTLRRAIATIATILVVALSPDYTAAQNATASNAFRFSAMGSFGVAVPFLATELGLSINRGPQDLTLRLAEALDFSGPRIEALGDAAILYGLRSRSRRGWVRASAGIGRVRRGYHCDEILFCALYGRPNSRNWGLAWQADAVWAPFAGLGFGAGLFGNINSAKSFGVVSVSMHVGQVR
jgi:hypothetical protein